MGSLKQQHRHLLYSLPSKSDKCLFMTYFDNYNESTKIDTPDIGEPYSIPTDKNRYSKSTMTLFGQTFNCLYNSYYNSGSYDLSSIDISEYDYVSAEMWLLPEGSRNDYGSIVRLIDWISLDPYFTSNDFPIFGPYYNGSSDNVTMYNGTTWNSNYAGFFRFGTRFRNQVGFLSVVYNNINKSIRYYSNGSLMLELRNRPFSMFSYTLQQNNTGKTSKATGIACFNYDKSINNGMNYPVPTKRY